MDIFHKMEDAGLAVPGGVYCFFFIIIGAFVFANLIVGVVVTNLQAANREMEEGMKVRVRGENCMQ